MDLNVSQLRYFITQVDLAATSFGVATSDVEAIGMALQKFFGYRCAPPVAIVPQAPAQLQFCIAPDCPLAANANCSAYETAFTPTYVNGTNFTSPMPSSNPPISTSTSTAPSSQFRKLRLQAHSPCPLQLHSRLL
jgi:hypothetical protein